MPPESSLTSERQLILDQLEKKKLSLRQASKDIGRSVGYLHDFVYKASPRRLPEVERKRLAKMLDCDERALQPAESGAELREEPQPYSAELPARRGNAQFVKLSDSMLVESTRDLPVRLTAAGALQGAFRLEDQIIDHVMRPPGLIGAKDAYAIYVSGKSMEPAYPDGDLVFVHPHRPVRDGDHVVAIVQAEGDATPQAYLRLLIRQDARWVWLKQYNGEPNITKLSRSTVISIHKVLRNRDLYGG